MLQIRPALEEDVPEMQKIGIEAFSRARGTIALLLEERYGVLGGRSWEERYAGGISAGNSFVGELDGKLCGFVSYSLNEESRQAWIKNNAVGPVLQGTGISTALCSHLIQHIYKPGAKLCRVHTPCHIPSAMKVYERVGFREPVYGIVYSTEVGCLSFGEVELASETCLQRMLYHYILESEEGISLTVHYRDEVASVDNFEAEEEDEGGDIYPLWVSGYGARREGVRVMTVTVPEENEREQRILEGLGFEELCRDVTYTLRFRL